MDPLNLLIARQDVADHVRDTADRARPKPASDRDPESGCRAKGGQFGPVVQVGW